MLLQLLLLIACSLPESKLAEGSVIKYVEMPLSDGSFVQPMDHSHHFKMRKKYSGLIFIEPRGENDTECEDEDSDFPPFLTEDQLKHGGIILCVLIGIYCFTFLAILFDDYFLPCIERFCATFNITQDVTGATFMAMATTAPEFFTNVVGTFITESDIGIGTVVGSNLYNTLAVSALGCLFASSPIKLDWWPVTRDCFIYICTIGLLVAVTWDGYIYWYKSLIMCLALVLYFIIMFNSKRIERRIKKWINYTDPDMAKENGVNGNVALENNNNMEKGGDLGENEIENICNIPKSFWGKVWFFYSWPLKVILFVLLPNPIKRPNLYFLTFVLCIVLIGLNAYVVSWMLTLIGITFGIPDSVLGLTFLAFGGGLPESLTIILLTRKGEGKVGVSNALGANTMNTLLTLGLPWLIKNIIDGFGKHSYIEIVSGTISYTILALLLVVTILLLTLYFNDFYLSKTIGIVLGIAYIILLAGAVVAEILLIKPC